MSTKKKKAKKLESIYVLISGEEEYIGCFRDEDDVKTYVEENSIEALVFKCIAVFECIPPEEPAYEFCGKDLESVLEGK